MVDLDGLYFDWLLTQLDPDGVTEEVAYVCGLLHECDFTRRVGRDINRASDGVNLRKHFLNQYEEADFEPHMTNDFLMAECTWFEMLTALADRLDFLYEGGVEGRFLEMVENLGLEDLITFRHIHDYDDDRLLVRAATERVNRNHIDRNGHGGIFPLQKAGYSDQREIEIWDQHAAYFREKLEGVLWTSTR